MTNTWKIDLGNFTPQLLNIDKNGKSYFEEGLLKWSKILLGRASKTGDTQMLEDSDIMETLARESRDNTMVDLPESSYPTLIYIARKEFAQQAKQAADSTNENSAVHHSSLASQWNSLVSVVKYQVDQEKD